MPNDSSLTLLLREVRACTLCAGSIPEPNPVLRAAESARVLIIGQAPGTRVHSSGVPWDDPSGERLRRWMGIAPDVFYDESKVAIIPMGFCYPGKGRSGDLPPRPECAATWHQQLLAKLPHIQCTLFIGQYAQGYYCNDDYTTLTQRVLNWRRLAPKQYVLPHPSPRNQLWLRKNPWFEADAVPHMQAHLRTLLNSD